MRHKPKLRYFNFPTLGGTGISGALKKEFITFFNLWLIFEKYYMYTNLL